MHIKSICLTTTQRTRLYCSKKVYFIGILNFNIFENKNYISRHLITNQETNTQDLKDFEFSFIELPKFTKELEVYDYISLKEFDGINALKTAEKKGLKHGIEQEKIKIAENLIDILDDKTIAAKTGLDNRDN